MGTHLKLTDIKLLIIFILPFLFTCGSGGTSASNQPIPIPTITITPVNPQVHSGESVQFTAVVTNSVSQTVDWSTTSGTITSSGLYTAPGSATILAIVQATLRDRKEITAKVEFSVLPPLTPNITITPTTLALDAKSSYQFSANFLNITNPVPRWWTGPFFDFTSDRIPYSGVVDSTGRYTAPLGSGKFEVHVVDMNNRFLPATFATVTVRGWGPITPVQQALPGRSHPSFTVLNDGTLLIAGGEDDGRSALLFDPAQQKVIKTISMLTNRAGHTATLLADGRVFMAGGGTTGLGGGIYLASTEIYDPTSQTFSAGPSLLNAKAYHQAALLKDGRVMIMGGWGGLMYYPECEIYDPTTNVISQLPTISIGLIGHRLLVMDDGRVLLVGGGRGGFHNFDILCVDPINSTVTKVGSLLLDRVDASVTALPDGRVMIIGNTWFTGQETAGYSHSTEIFDPRTGLSIEGPTMYWGRNSPSVLWISPTKFLVLGYGWTGGIERYDTETGVFEPVGSAMLSPYFIFQAVITPEKKVIFSHEQYDITTLEILDAANL